MEDGLIFRQCVKDKVVDPSAANQQILASDEDEGETEYGKLLSGFSKKERKKILRKLAKMDSSEEGGGRGEKKRKRKEKLKGKKSRRKKHCHHSSSRSSTESETDSSSQEERTKRKRSKVKAKCDKPDSSSEEERKKRKRSKVKAKQESESSSGKKRKRSKVKRQPSPGSGEEWKRKKRLKCEVKSGGEGVWVESKTVRRMYEGRRESHEYEDKHRLELKRHERDSIDRKRNMYSERRKEDCSLDGRKRCDSDSGDGERAKDKTYRRCEYNKHHHRTH